MLLPSGVHTQLPTMHTQLPTRMVSPSLMPRDSRRKTCLGGLTAHDVRSLTHDLRLLMHVSCVRLAWGILSTTTKRRTCPPNHVITGRSCESRRCGTNLYDDVNVQLRTLQEPPTSQRTHHRHSRGSSIARSGHDIRTPVKPNDSRPETETNSMHHTTNTSSLPAPVPISSRDTTGQKGASDRTAPSNV